MIVLVIYVIVSLVALVVSLCMLFEKTLTIYVCSYGGVGSWSAKEYFQQNFRNVLKVHHIHERSPPMKLRYAHRTNESSDSFFGKEVIPEEELHKHKVVFVYRDDVSKSVKSRFGSEEHRKNVGIYAPFEDMRSTMKDVFKLHEFFDNYAQKGRNYPVWFIKFEAFVNKEREIIERLGIRKAPWFTRMRLQAKNRPVPSWLEKIYDPLTVKLRKLPEIMAV